MDLRQVGQTDMQFSSVSFGASSMGWEFTQSRLEDVLKSVRVALDGGINFIDTSPYYGRGMSEVLLGLALQDVPRDSYYLGTKLGRYDASHFDFSAKRVRESVDVSLHRLRTDHLDVVLCHDVEFYDLDYVVEETIPALKREQAKGKVRYVGVSGYPMKMFQHILSQTDLDVVLSYNHYTLQNQQFADLVPMLKEKGVGILNAAPFSARLLTNAPLPPWHKAPEHVREIAEKAAKHCEQAGSDIAKLALQFSIRNKDMATCVTGSANPGRIQGWLEWAEEPIDEQLLAEVQGILEPIHNWHYIEGRPENNDDPTKW